ncbi:hypothetical protein [Granulicella paludicola]|uniref:hypothetical protein n=1 Tax=Granulicella paludicola TaxID=474951 RepID=UPI0021E01966|nr:hypothetical protein [Granulicella paludicola]
MAVIAFVYAVFRVFGEAWGLDRKRRGRGKGWQDGNEKASAKANADPYGMTSKGKKASANVDSYGMRSKRKRQVRM